MIGRINERNRKGILEKEGKAVYGSKVMQEWKKMRGIKIRNK